jgi:hypothetical protein
LNPSRLGYFVQVLTDRERQLLEEISADIEQTDPRLAARLGSRTGATWRGRWRRSESTVGAVAIPGGLALTIATFPWSTVVAFAGVAAAFWGCNVHAAGAQARATAVVRRIRNGRTDDR